MREVADAAGAMEAVRLCRLRWRIEEIFRSLEADGMRLEDTQVQDAGGLFKLAALVGLAAAARTMRLGDARDGSPRPATDVVGASVLPAAEAITPTLESKTARQQNPHPRPFLAWLSWIIARLGGWNCPYKPPGPKPCGPGGHSSRPWPPASPLPPSQMCEPCRLRLSGCRHSSA